MVVEAGCVVIATGTHGALCVTVTLLPATLIEPLRFDAVVFAATMNVVVPLPLPLAPAVIVIHALSLDEVHAQLPAVVIAIDPLAPFASNAKLLGATA